MAFDYNEAKKLIGKRNEQYGLWLLKEYSRLESAKKFMFDKEPFFSQVAQDALLDYLETLSQEEIAKWIMELAYNVRQQKP